MTSLTTSTQRTYRHVRLCILGAVLMLAVAVTQVILTRGPLQSISAAFYTPARGVFVGVLFATALALVALSGHSVERAMLVLAALFAPIIAIVPTAIVTGDAPGVVVPCASPCVPAVELPGVHNGMLAVVVIGGLGVIAAIVLGVIEHTLTRAALIVIVIAAIILVGFATWALAAPASFARHGHLAAAIGFFAAIAFSAVAAAFAASGQWRILYGVLAALLLLDLIWLAVQRAVFLGESIAIVLFTVFWVAQTVQKWDEVDPRAR